MSNQSNPWHGWNKPVNLAWSRIDVDSYCTSSHLVTLVKFSLLKIRHFFSRYSSFCPPSLIDQLGIGKKLLKGLQNSKEKNNNNNPNISFRSGHDLWRDHHQPVRQFWLRWFISCVKPVKSLAWVEYTCKLCLI